MAFKLSFFVISLFAAVIVSAQNIDEDLKNRIDALNQKNGVAKTDLVLDALNRAEDTNVKTIKDILASDSYNNRLNSYNHKARQVLGLETQESFTPLPSEETNVIGDRLVLFVSSSMPISVLRNYVRDIDRVGGVMIFRGTIGGIDSFMPTVEFLRQLLAVDVSCTAANCDMRTTNISIDPQRFSHHGIARVPALIFEKNMKIQAYCKQGDSGPKAQTIAYGDASLAGLTNAIYQANEEPALKALLNTLRGI